LEVDQPVVAADRIVGFWHSVGDEIGYGSTRDLGLILRHLHQLTAPPELQLAPLKPLAVTRLRIERVNIADADRDYLRARYAELSQAYERLTFEGDPVVLHGDANVGNLILDRHGRALLSDLDSFNTGPAEWDLIQTAMFYDRFGWHTEQEYADFVTAYGRDVLQWPGYETLAQVRELLMVSWMAQNVNESEPAAEFAKRLETMRTDGSRRDWSPL
jgi:aminoglycoside phosphotransferase (APT) family kinase protein